MKRLMIQLFLLLSILLAVSGCSPEPTYDSSSVNNTEDSIFSESTKTLASNPKEEVPDSFVQTNLQSLLIKDDNEKKLSITHFPDIASHTDTVDIDIAMLYELGWEHYQLQACYQYDKSSDLWTQLWLGDAQYTECEFIEDNIKEYIADRDYFTGEDVYQGYSWAYEIEDIDLYSMTATIWYYITLEDLEWSDTEVFPLEFESYNSYNSIANQRDRRYSDQIVAEIDCSYTIGGTKDFDNVLQIIITSKSISSKITSY